MSRVGIEVAATGPKEIGVAARRADRVGSAVGAETARPAECIHRFGMQARLDEAPAVGLPKPA